MVSLLSVVLFACGGSESAPSEAGGSASAAGGSTQQGLGGSSGSSSAGQGGSAGGSGGNAACQLEELADGPRVALTGSVCGQDVSFTTRAGRAIRLSRRSLFYPIDEITTITVKDDPSDSEIELPEYFDEFALLFNLALDQTGPTLEVQSGDYALDTGMLVACGFGSLGFRAGTVGVAIESVEGNFDGQVRMSVSNISVLGFDPAYGKTTLPQCEGTVSVTLEGAYSHNPG